MVEKKGVNTATTRLSRLSIKMWSGDSFHMFPVRKQMDNSVN